MLLFFFIQGGIFFRRNVAIASFVARMSTKRARIVAMERSISVVRRKRGRVEEREKGDEGASRVE